MHDKENSNPGAIDLEGLHNDVAKSEEKQQDMRQWWDHAHETSHEFWLSGSAASDVWERLTITDRIVPGAVVLNIGVGLGYCTRELQKSGCVVDVLDISPIAIARVRGVIRHGWLPAQFKEFPENMFDLAISHLVTQHMVAADLAEQLDVVIRGLKPSGLFAMQFSFPLNGETPADNEESGRVKSGGVFYTMDRMQSMVDRAGGRISWSKQIGTFPEYGSGWYGVHIRPR